MAKKLKKTTKFRVSRIVRIPLKTVKHERGVHIVNKRLFKLVEILKELSAYIVSAAPSVSISVKDNFMTKFIALEYGTASRADPEKSAVYGGSRAPYTIRPVLSRWRAGRTKPHLRMVRTIVAGLAGERAAGDLGKSNGKVTREEFDEWKSQRNTRRRQILGDISNFVQKKVRRRGIHGAFTPQEKIKLSRMHRAYRLARLDSKRRVTRKTQHASITTADQVMVRGSRPVRMLRRAVFLAEMELMKSKRYVRLLDFLSLQSYRQGVLQVNEFLNTYIKTVYKHLVALTPVDRVRHSPLWSVRRRQIQRMIQHFASEERPRTLEPLKSEGYELSLVFANKRNSAA